MALREAFLWSEKYRPKTVADCILPDRLKMAFQQFVDGRELPNLILHGPSGTGKTTTAQAMCDQIGVDWLKINASDENGIDVLRNKVRSFASTMSFSDARKCVVMDEADYMNPNSLQPAFRSFLDDFAINSSFVFTCNYVNKIIPPLQSRCTVIPFQFKRDERAALMKGFWTRVKTILQQEQVKCDGKLLSEVIQRYFPDFRRTLNALQGAVVDNEITLAVLGQSQDAAFKELFVSLTEKDFTMARRWVGQNIDTDDMHAFRAIFEWLDEHAKPACIPQMIVILNEYQYKSAFCPDKQLNLTACLVDIMADLETL